MCLHACGVSTDMVMRQCLQSNASFVICPCCYGGVRNTHLMTYPTSNYYKEAGIVYKVCTKLKILMLIVCFNAKEKIEVF